MKIYTHLWIAVFVIVVLLLKDQPVLAQSLVWVVAGIYLVRLLITMRSGSDVSPVSGGSKKVIANGKSMEVPVFSFDEKKPALSARIIVFNEKDEIEIIPYYKHKDEDSNKKVRRFWAPAEAIENFIKRKSSD